MWFVHCFTSSAFEFSLGCDISAQRYVGNLLMSTFPRLRFIVAVDMQISQTATTLAVVFELFSTKQEKLIEMGLQCLHSSLVLVKRLRN